MRSLEIINSLLKESSAHKEDLEFVLKDLEILKILLNNLTSYDSMSLFMIDISKNRNLKDYLKVYDYLKENKIKC